MTIGRLPSGWGGESLSCRVETVWFHYAEKCRLKVQTASAHRGRT
ncbi:hypothetical protein AB9Q94_03455 [Neisseria gonorrhoeae]